MFLDLTNATEQNSTKYTRQQHTHTHTLCLPEAHTLSDFPTMAPLRTMPADEFGVSNPVFRPYFI